MEEGLTQEKTMAVSDSQKDSFLDKIKDCFDCKEQDIRTYSPLTLAYIGDVVYDLIIRTVVVERANRGVSQLHKQTIRYVRAEAQARMAERLQEFLTPDEEDIYKRGRNAKSYTAAKNASIGDYRKATGLEALVGFLYLTDRTDRVLELVRKGLELTEMNI